jgi:hypothetical protein
MASYRGNYHLTNQHVLHKYPLPLVARKPSDGNGMKPPVMI